MSLKPVFLKSERVKNIKKVNYRFFIVTESVASVFLLCHFLFSFLFLLIHAYFLALINVGSCLIYAVCFFTNRKGHHNIALFAGPVEVILHSVLACIYLGWSSGFHFYILCLIPLAFFSTTTHKLMKKLLSVLYCAIYMLLNAFTLHIVPYYSLQEGTITFFNFMNIFFTFAILSVISYYYNHETLLAEKELKEMNNKLDILAKTDPLTELMNRRSMMNNIILQIQQSNRTHTPFTLILADIDDFKDINDQHGHDIGDYILTEASAILQSSLRSNDFVSRWGGEEFMLLLPGVSHEESQLLIDRLRNNIQNHTFFHENTCCNITMTFGAIVYESKMEAKELIKRADKALYAGKRNGKNCIIYSSAVTI